MAFYYGINSNYANSFFSVASNSSSSNSLSSLTGLLSDYSSIRNGSYSKLLQKYYSLGESENITTSKNATSTSKDNSKTLVSISDSTDDLKESADKLIKNGKESVFSKEEVDGKAAYNKDKIYKAVKDFVDDYNAVIDSTADSNTKSIASNSSAMIRTTLTNEDVLGELGITVDSEGKLTLDEKKFKEADMSTAKTLFNGTGSYAYQMSAKASMINFNAETEMNRSNTYTNNGSYSYNYSSGSLFDYMF